MKRSQVGSGLPRALRRRQTDAERALWAKLRNRQIGGVKFRRQQPVGPYVCDFVSFEKRLVVEIDGGQHNSGTTRLGDAERTAWLRERGYRVVRFWNTDVVDNLDGVLEAIMEAVA